MAKKFQRNIEDFTCENCGKTVLGNGYTNHCPYCLFSKHADIHPGDRQELCGGLMEPIFVELVAGQYILTHQCQKCGFKKKNKTAPNDNINNLIKLSETIAKNTDF